MYAPLDSLKRRSERGFTLIELLVVVAIIALLIAILLPSLGKARAQAKRTACGTSLKNWGTAIYVYSTDQNNYFTANAWAAGTYDSYMSNKSPKMRVCPADAASPYTNSLGKVCQVNYLFARYNPKVSGFSGTYKMTQLRFPASKAVMTDGYWNNGASFGNIHGGTASGGDALVNPTGLTSGPYPPWDEAQIINERHNGFGQIIFLDSHVDSVKWADYVANIPDNQIVAPALPSAADQGKNWTIWNID